MSVSPAISVTVEYTATAKLTISVSPAVGHLGETFLFSGRLVYLADTILTYPVENAQVFLVLEGVGDVGNAYTDVQGYYNIPWKADKIGVLKFHTEVRALPQFTP